jgi:hypothetical protein
MSDAVRVQIDRDVSKRPAITARHIVYVRDDGSLAIVPAGSEIDVPEFQNISIKDFP